MIGSEETVFSHPFRVAIVKWDRFSIDSIVRSVRAAFGPVELAVFHEARFALTALRAAPVQLGIFGLTLPDMDGLDLLGIVESEGLAERRVVMTWRADERTRHELSRSRIHGMVETITDGTDRLREVWGKLAAEKSRDGGRAFRSSFPKSRETLLDQILSNAELQVLAVLADGSDDIRAADTLGLSPATVHTHRQRIMRKLGVQTRSGLIQEGLRRGVIRFTDTGVLRPGLEAALAERKERAIKRLSD